MNIQESDTARLNEKWNDGRIVDERPKKLFAKITFGKWRRLVLISCVIALAIDPLFLLIPLIDSRNYCFAFDKTLAITVTVLRTLSDTTYVIYFFRHLITSRGEQWIVHSKAIPKKFSLFIYWTIDFLSVLPIPQVVAVIAINGGSVSLLLVSKKILKWSIFCQYIPRFVRTYPIYRQVTKNTGNVVESKWIGAGLNFFLYMLSSFAFGAFWYVNAVERQSKCWHNACATILNNHKDNRTMYPLGCYPDDLFCKSNSRKNNSLVLNSSCPIKDLADFRYNSTEFNFGLYTDALKSGVLEVEYNDFMMKFIYCYRWGLRHLSALGQNLETSRSVGENLFAIVICVSGLILFAILIGNVQKYLQSSTNRVEEKEENKRDTEKWMTKRNLPDHLKDGIRKHKDYKWKETRGMEEKTLIKSFPKHLIKDIRLHVYKDLFDKIKQVPQIRSLNDRARDDLRSRLQTVYYTANSHIVEEGKAVEEMLFIVSGKLESSSKTGLFPNSFRLVAGYLCGEELFEWAFDPQSSQYPISKRTIVALGQVEGFVISADELKDVATKFREENQQATSVPPEGIPEPEPNRN